MNDRTMVRKLRRTARRAENTRKVLDIDGRIFTRHQQRLTDLEGTQAKLDVALTDNKGQRVKVWDEIVFLDKWIDKVAERLDRLATLHGKALEVQNAFDMGLQHRVTQLEDRLAAEQNYSAFLATDIRNLYERFNQLEVDVCAVTDSHADSLDNLGEGLLMTGDVLQGQLFTLNADVQGLARGLVRLARQRTKRGFFARLRGQL
jgi:uncharacterized coiled-coil protein SlyX